MFFSANFSLHASSEEMIELFDSSYFSNKFLAIKNQARFPGK
jgi:hypothetical protein